MDRLDIDGAAIVLIRGDITEQEVDAIVNAANSSLLGGGGVDGAIHRRGGAAILDACKELRETEYPDGLPTGEAVITTAGNLPANYVIHTVGPRWSGGKRGEADLLADAYWNSLEIAREHGLRTIAFPSISTGAYRFPVDEAAAIALTIAADYVYDHAGELDEVRFVLFSEEDLAIFREALVKVAADLEASADDDLEASIDDDLEASFE